MDYATWRIINAPDPKGRAALEKFVETAGPDEIAKLVSVVKDTPAALAHLADAVRTLAAALKDRGLL